MGKMGKGKGTIDINKVIEKHRKSIDKAYTLDEIQEILKNYPGISYPLINIIYLINIDF